MRLRVEGSLKPGSRLVVRSDKMPRLLVEVPEKPCDHEWQVLREEKDQMILVCKKEGCGATKRVKKPGPIQENVGGKKVLFG